MPRDITTTETVGAAVALALIAEHTIEEAHLNFSDAKAETICKVAVTYCDGDSESLAATIKRFLRAASISGWGGSAYSTLCYGPADRCGDAIDGLLAEKVFSAASAQNAKALWEKARMTAK